MRNIALNYSFVVVCSDFYLKLGAKVKLLLNTSFCIIILDIDDFKKINDTYGHLVGDSVLVKLSKLLTNNIRQSDMLGRWGGEEFLIITPHTEYKRLLVIWQRNYVCLFLKKILILLERLHVVLV